MRRLTSPPWLIAEVFATTLGVIAGCSSRFGKVLYRI
jgi:hypothetical protein